MREKQLKEAKMCPCCESTVAECTCSPSCKGCSCNKDKVSEGLADLADAAERDHEVQMARADLYKIAKYAIKLHDMLKGVSEEQGLEGWVQAKITKAADYIGAVYHNLDYDQKFGDKSDPAGTADPSETIGLKMSTESKNKFVKSNDPYKALIAEKLNKKLKGK